mmetsp:Transcript_37417/g.60897  ORF Transcript_37417/g.60897 Transcript_37417/m.60897 type:complete len:570 (-) Transcript_37417:211-1920(-)|eukprot:CAMPEP_0203795542 /NCGR_PEP_ID=MMETSP0100_2-20121128/7297_1 /ASSEMBLY_ACC=CAM_ASM_000210 /TAXON_ID=96639 /ORGANISM=" , Strain NY0313808BC1" /LENGTH=569 /DNA_ID=CAMNT_0050700081 /DNA_START=422 /DNA_END=2131 /DNA_ORIENTATION=+
MSSDQEGNSLLRSRASSGEDILKNVGTVDGRTLGGEYGAGTPVGPTRKNVARKDTEENKPQPVEKSFVFCTECGNKCRKQAKFCPECGNKIVAFVPPPQQQQQGEEGESSSESSSEEDEGEEEEEEEDSETGKVKRRASSFDPFQKVQSLNNIIPPKIEKTPPIQPQNMNEDVYEIKFEGGVSGLSFDDDWLGKSIVVDDLPEESFIVPNDNGTVPNVLHCGDFVVAINDELCAGLCIERVEELLAAAQESGRYKVRFRTGARLQDAFGKDGDDVIEARSIIYKQKSKPYEPPEHMDMVYGYVQRFRGEKIISFHFFRESDNKFILGAILPKNGKGRIIFHNSQNIKFDGDVNEVHAHSDSAKYLGCMVHNFIGTAFTMHDYRVENPTSTRKRIHHELGLVLYDSNVFGRVPNSLQAILPRWDPEQGLKGQAVSITDRFASTSKTRLSKDLNIIQKFNAKKGDEYQALELDEQEELLTFETKKPSWNEELQAWTLNFNGRVKLASKKNFLLVPNSKNEGMDEEFGHDTVCMRFGKVEKDRFSLDYRHPMSPLQAFGISLTSFSKKLVVT